MCSVYLLWLCSACGGMQALQKYIFHTDILAVSIDTYIAA